MGGGGGGFIPMLTSQKPFDVIGHTALHTVPWPLLTSMGVASVGVLGIAAEFVTSPLT